MIVSAFRHPKAISCGKEQPLEVSSPSLTETADVLKAIRMRVNPIKVFGGRPVDTITVNCPASGCGFGGGPDPSETMIVLASVRR